MIFDLFKAESTFDALLHTYRVRADRIMISVMVFLTIVCLLISAYKQSWLPALLIGFPTLVVSIWLTQKYSGELITRIFIGCGFMVFTGLIIHQTLGDIEAHFSAFGLIGALLYYRDWRTIAVATVFMYSHHLILGYIQSLGKPIYVFDGGDFLMLFIQHVAYFMPFAGMMGYLAIWLRREAYEEQHVIALAQSIMHGNLLETNEVIDVSGDTSLIFAVLAMKNRLLDLLRIMPVPAAVIRVDTDVIVSFNAAWKRILGVFDESILLRDSPIWAESGTWEDLMGKLYESPNKMIDNIDVALIRYDGQQLLFELSLILHEDVEPIMAIMTLEDVTQRRQAELTMHKLAYRDVLTDLPNRTSLHAELVHALANWQEKQEPFAVALLDLDGFKPVNDSYGHDAGDNVLQVIGARLTSINRTSDIAARLGGDEFAVILRYCPTLEYAVQIAERFVVSLSEPIYLEKIGNRINIGVSIGVAHINDADAKFETILKHADIALYDAKAAGKNRVSAFHPSIKI